MAIKIMDKEYTKESLFKYFGDFSHVVGIRKYTLSEGKSNGCKIIEVSTGSGLVFEINESRGMDIGRCMYKSIPISYQGYNKEIHPGYYEAFSDGWLRNFSGGLLVTCGLKSIGKPEIDKDEILPLHGRISNIPAERVNIEEYWEGEKLFLKITGIIRESKALNYNIILKREIKVEAGSNKISIRDIIENQGFDDEEVMILYHFNIGHPILDNSSKLLTHSEKVIPRDEDAMNQSEEFYKYLEPTKGYKDIVYYHKLKDNDGLSTVGIINEKIGMGISLIFNKNELDCFTQWKFTNLGNYVAGIEPGNAYVDGRIEERDKGNIKVLKAQSRKEYKLDINILTSSDELDQFKKKNDF